MNLLTTTVLSAAMLAGGCTINSPFLQPQQPAERPVQQPLQPIIINQMPGQQLPSSAYA